MQGGERYNSISDYLKSYFGHKTVKLSIDAGFSCPNRDGKISTGGCLFCSPEGSGELSSTISEQIELLSSKWSDVKYLAYFQSHTNTYAPVDILRAKYYEALDDERISGIVIATRPDCLNDDVLDLLEEIEKKYFMWIELGLQTIHPHTSDMMNIGYDLKTYDNAVDKLLERNIRIVTHLILGLPNESNEQILESVKYVSQKAIFGLKLHLLNVVHGSGLHKILPNYIPFQSIDEYVNLVIDCLEIIPSDITIHRLTGDVPRKILVSPEWSYKKRTILNRINYELKHRNTYQGRLCNK
ncbi:MAG TPA: TIGR01212 family radical SAM protein [Mogibacterium sp.]|nr:TIGR01212 family radical SAM protein [Mogibacterium sp.]